MKWLIAAVVLLVALLPTVGSMAQDEQNGENEPNFKLTIYGDPPKDEAFEVTYAPCNSKTGCVDIEGFWPICGDEKLLDYSEGEGPGPCKGHGTTYTRGYAFMGNDVVAYSFARRYVGDDGQRRQEVFASTNGHYVPGNRAYAASYTYPNADDEQELPEGLPNTGAGGLVGGRPAPGNILGVVSVLAVGGYATQRRRRRRVHG